MSQKQQERLEQNVTTAEEPVEMVQTEPVSENLEATSTPVAQDAHTADTASEGDQPVAASPQKKRKKRKTKWVSAEDVSPKPSRWPLLLTVSICVLLMGVMIHPIVIGFGAILVIGSIIGWMLERR